jgi:hypothetical protein
MKTLTDVLSDVDQLSEEDQAGLAAHLLANFRGAPLGPNDRELARREAEIDAGTAEFITFDELAKQSGDEQGDPLPFGSSNGDSRDS